MSAQGRPVSAMPRQGDAPATAAGQADLADLASQVRQWLHRQVIPIEADLDGGGPEAVRQMDRLSGMAREAGLWGLHYPLACGGRVGRLAQYLPIAEAEGGSEFGPAIFGSEATLDAHMLHRHASPTVRERFLAPLARGAATPSYGMSEPGSIGSMPSTLRTSARLEAGSWRIKGRKWFISRASHADFVTVVARTREEGPAGDSLSMIVVPTDAPGFRVERELDIFGRLQGQCEISFDDVRVPADHLLGTVHQGAALMQERLGLGRVLRSCHWLGLAQRCFELMCDRIISQRGDLASLGDKQLARQHVFDSHLAIASARALVHAAAVQLDTGACADVAVNVAKVAASRALGKAADSAIQIFGAEGVSALTPLSGIYRTARATRILDGTDESLVSAVGRRLLDITAKSLSSRSAT